MTPGEIRRLYFIVRTFLSYGLDELIPKMRITLPLRIWRRMLFWMPNRHKGQPLGERLRLALQELGPVWIKFGKQVRGANQARQFVNKGFVIVSSNRRHLPLLVVGQISRCKA